jgi:hypothetical protein
MGGYSMRKLSEHWKQFKYFIDWTHTDTIIVAVVFSIGAAFSQNYYYKEEIAGYKKVISFAVKQHKEKDRDIKECNEALAASLLDNSILEDRINELISLGVRK